MIIFIDRKIRKDFDMSENGNQHNNNNTSSPGTTLTFEQMFQMFQQLQMSAVKAETKENDELKARRSQWKSAGFAWEVKSPGTKYQKRVQTASMPAVDFLELVKTFPALANQSFVYVTLKENFDIEDHI